MEHPSEIEFNGTESKISIENSTSNFIAYKFRTTNPKDFTVLPSSGVIVPNKTEHFTVCVSEKAFANKNFNEKEEKLLLQTITIDAAIAQKDVAEIWNHAQEETPDMIQNRKIALKKVAKKRRVGIVGYGLLGQYLTKAILEDPIASKKFEVAFVWNRSSDKINDIPKEYILENLDDFESRGADIIVEVAHPIITEQYGVKFLKSADYLIGSPTALANQKVEEELRRVCDDPQVKGAAYVATGALWGAQDIIKMAKLGTLKGLTVTMKKAPHHLKLSPPLSSIVQESADQNIEKVVFSGSVRELCPLAPNNVNTMATAAIAAFNLGFDKVRAVLISDPTLEKHVVEVDVEGPGQEQNKFRVLTTRSNPAAKGAVTGAATYGSFLSSLYLAENMGKGVHVC